MSPWLLRNSVRHLFRGEVIAYPTEGVYGLGCDPFDAESVHRLLALKHRPASRGLILIASHFEQLRPLLAELPATTERKIRNTWPGAVTWLWPSAPEVPRWLTGKHNSLAVRVTAHPIAAALCEAFGGPLVSTSANISGRPAARSPIDVQRSFGDQLSCVVHGDLSRQNGPSEIRDVMSGKRIR